MRAVFRIATGILLAAQMAGGAQAQSLEEFFKAQPFTIVVGYPPGAGYDMYARLIARRIGQYLPGTPKVVVQNMPGAGSLSAANHLYNIARQDGSIIGTFSRGITMLPIIDSTGVRYETLKFNWIGSPSSEVSLAIAWHDSGINTFEDLRTRGMTAATSGPGSDGNIYGRVLNTILGTKIKTVTGYQGSAESMLAIERKEVDGATSVSYAAIKTAQRGLAREQEDQSSCTACAESEPGAQAAFRSSSTLQSRRTTGACSKWSSRVSRSAIRMPLLRMSPPIGLRRSARPFRRRFRIRSTWPRLRRAASWSTA